MSCDILCVSSEFIAVVIFTIMASGGNDTESSPDLDEFLASSFDSDTSDNKEEGGGQENADSLEVDL